MTNREAGFTMVEAMVVVAVSGILLAITLPISAFWLERADISTARGELSHGFGKAIALAIRNEQAVPIGQPAAALCLSTYNELSVLTPSEPTEIPNCATSTGTLVWSSTLPAGIDVLSNNADVSCMCFSSAGTLTSNNCNACAITPTIFVGKGTDLDTVHVR